LSGYRLYLVSDGERKNWQGTPAGTVTVHLMLDVMSIGVMTGWQAMQDLVTCISVYRRTQIRLDQTTESRIMRVKVLLGAVAIANDWQYCPKH
jgi:cytochrome b